MITTKTGATIASAAAMFALSALANAATPPAGSSGPALGSADTVHCYGVNSCKGTADCKTTQHDCKGMNSCKGMGWQSKKSEAECKAAGGTVQK